MPRYKLSRDQPLLLVLLPVIKAAEISFSLYIFSQKVSGCARQRGMKKKKKEKKNPAYFLVKKS